jgi:hypothetical protein
MTNENDFTFDLLIVNNKTYRNAKAMCPNKVVVPQCVYDQISDEIRRECADRAVDYLTEGGTYPLEPWDEIRAAIMGKEAGK